MSKIIKISFVLSMCMVIAGCMTYTYGGNKYSNSKDALTFQAAKFTAMLAGVQPREKPVANNLRFNVPNFNHIEKIMVYGDSKEGRNFVASTIQADLRSTYDAIVKRGIFAKTTFEEGFGQHAAPVGNESVIYYYSPDVNTGQYYYVSKSMARTPLQFDRGGKDDLAKIMFFLDSVEALAFKDADTNK
jgi:hypothetical protein